MFVVVPIENNTIPVGSVLSYNSSSLKWGLATDAVAPIGVLVEIKGDADNGWFGHVTFAGTAMALSSRDIPDSGGWLAVENGKIYVDTAAAEHCGLVSPLPQGQSTRTAGALILVHIR